MKKKFQEQYRRLQCSAMDHGIIRILVFDYQRYLWQPFSLACSDLRSCYYIIVLSSAILALQLIGIPLPSIIIMLDKIQHMPHTVRTAYGDYYITYVRETIPNKFRHFMMGLLHGNGFAHHIWSIISSIIFSALLTQVFDIHFVNSFTAEITQLLGFSYVDDYEIVQSDDDI